MGVKSYGEAGTVRALDVDRLGTVAATDENGQVTEDHNRYRSKQKPGYVDPGEVKFDVPILEAMYRK